MPTVQRTIDIDISSGEMAQLFTELSNHGQIHFINEVARHFAMWKSHDFQTQLEMIVRPQYAPELTENGRQFILVLAEMIKEKQDNG